MLNPQKKHAGKFFIRSSYCRALQSHCVRPKISQETKLMNRRISCPDCEESGFPVSRREFVRVVGSSAAAVAAASALPASALTGGLRADDQPKPASETLGKKLYSSLTPAQREESCFPW